MIKIEYVNMHKRSKTWKVGLREIERLRKISHLEILQY